MKSLEKLLAIIVVISLSLCTIFVSGGLVLRSSSLYSYYFNETRVVEKISTSISNMEMADEISSYMYGTSGEQFQVYEDTGYMKEALFTENESYNMLQSKKFCDKILTVGLVSCAVTVGIYILLIDLGKKRTLAVCNFISLGISGILLAFEHRIGFSEKASEKLFYRLKLVRLPEDSTLLRLLGGDFSHTAVWFSIIAGAIVTLAVFYICYMITRSKKMFTNGKYK